MGLPQKEEEGIRKEEEEEEEMKLFLIEPNHRLLLTFYLESVILQSLRILERKGCLLELRLKSTFSVEMSESHGLEGRADSAVLLTLGVVQAEHLSKLHVEPSVQVFYSTSFRLLERVRIQKFQCKLLANRSR